MANKRKCKHCKTSTHDFVVLGVMAFCNVDHATKYAYANKHKGAAIKRRAAHSIAKKDKTNLAHQHKLTQVSFNKLRRMQCIKFYTDKGIQPVCISCGREAKGKVGYFCCGHNKTRGEYPELAYDEINTELQCNKSCNMELSGNINGNKTTHGYIEGLIIKYGEEEAKRRMDYLEENHPPKNLKWFEIKELRAKINKQIRAMELTKTNS
jgi:hypothetical protein